MATHDSDVQAACAFCVLLVRYLQPLQHFDNFEVSMVGSVVEAVESLRICLTQRFYYRAFNDQSHNVCTRKIYLSESQLLTVQ